MDEARISIKNSIIKDNSAFDASILQMTDSLLHNSIISNTIIINNPLHKLAAHEVLLKQPMFNNKD